ncbi:NAD(P)H-binding protein [Phototrophicus methaneseepsis]|uniref:NAD(P)H-binding protein n=1 Tax=Phototrophicus methaneseepsis TaxID=2710758 RepID=A0A7S8IE54_9CHLR|nr:NAD-dependent epimerase/dehydratase family protein [Phototrophicus methaneseepsis]QPC81478.1 NAD(P)H-binding protein [Phototrophicus methaneseepsis]
MILITGGTGFIGRHVVRALMERGLPLRCLLPEHRAGRVPWDANAPNSPEIIVGTILDQEAVFRAVTGAHTIIHLENAMWWGRERDLERIEVAGTRNLITQARAARVGRLITVSHLGAASSSAYMLHRIKGQVEEMIRASGLAYTIIRSGIVFGEDDAFINNIAMMLSTNPFFYLMPGMGEVSLHPIYIDDLVRAVVSSLEQINTVDRVLEIGGPEYTTIEDLLRTVMRVTRMHRLIISMPPYVMRGLARLYSRIFPRSFVTPHWLDILATNRTTQLGNTYDYFGFQPRRFEDTLVTYMPQQRYYLKTIRFAFRRRPRRL